MDIAQALKIPATVRRQKSEPPCCLTVAGKLQSPAAECGVSRPDVPYALHAPGHRQPDLCRQSATHTTVRAAAGPPVVTSRQRRRQPGHSPGIRVR